MLDFSKIEKKYKPKEKGVTNIELKKLGINSEGFADIVEKMEDLRDNPPNIIIAECLKKREFSQDYFKKQILRKKQKYVMSVGVYKQLHYDTYTKTKLLKPSTTKFKNLYRPYKGQDLTNKTLLFSRQGGIGDLIMLQPCMRYLKEKYPTCKIILACGPQYHAMVENWGCIDTIYAQPYPFQVMLGADYHAIFEGVIERCQEAHTTNAYVLFSKWLGLNLPEEKLRPVQEPKEDLVKFCKDLLWKWNIMDNKFVIMQMRASSVIRIPNPEIFKNIVNFITSKGYSVIITDSARQKPNIDKFIETVDDKDMVFNFSEHSKTLDYSIAMTSLAHLAIAPDSAFNHIAASLGVKCFGIFGAFLGELRLSTYKDSAWINCKADCAPCFTHGPNHCKNTKGNYSNCYNNIDYDEAYKKIEELMESD